MRLILAALLVVLASSPGFAINRYNLAGKTCGEVQSIIAREGAAVLRHTSPRGLPLYDRYVRDGRYCRGSEYAAFSTVPTKGNLECPVYRCRPFSNRD
jgi:hypothetical protein